MTLVLELVLAAVLVGGGIFALVGSYGLSATAASDAAPARAHQGHHHRRRRSTSRLVDRRSAGWRGNQLAGAG
jgi:hypothetical protein